jgi:hypothetical protein
MYVACVDQFKSVQGFDAARRGRILTARTITHRIVEQAE